MAAELLPPDEDPAWQLIGLAGSDASLPADFAAQHDTYLAQWERQDHEHAAPAPAAHSQEGAGSGPGHAP
jgi:hypothetical protein